MLPGATVGRIGSPARQGIEAIGDRLQQLEQCQQKIGELEKKLKETTDALVMSQALNKGLKRRVEGLQEMADSNEWTDEPPRGKEALALLFPDGVAAGALRVMAIKDRWCPGTLRDLFMSKKEDACACRRELAANGLTHPQLRFEDGAILGEGGFGIVRRGRCKKTKKNYAVKMSLVGGEATCLIREMAAYAIMERHKNIIGVEALSDVTGSEGIVMELAVCDLYQASSGTSETSFSVSQQICFEADATEGLHYMHGAGIIHCDHKLQNVLICRSSTPMGFVGKVTDPGVWYGLGEMRVVNTGTLGWSPLENVHVEVEAAPNQDTFAVGVDLCFILARPDMKDGVSNIFCHPKLMSADETDRLQALRAEGRDLDQFWGEVTVRTMSDGSLPRIFLQPGSLSPALPQTELLKTCEVLRQIVSGDPMDRPSMPVVTAFLRDLAGKTAALEETRAAVPQGIDLPPDTAIPVIPPVVAPHAEGEDNDEDDAVPLVEAIEAPRGSSPHVSASHGSAPLAAQAGPVAIPAVLPVVAPHSEGEERGAGAAVPLVEANEEPHGSVSRGSAPLAAQEGPVALPVVLPVVAPHAAGEGNDTGAAALLVEAIEAPHGSAPVAAETEPANVAIPSLERGHLAPPPVVEPNAEGERDGAGAEMPLADAIQAPADLGPPAAAPLPEVEASDADMASLEEIDGCEDFLLRPSPVSPAEVMENHIAGIWRTLGCSPPSASRVDVGGGGGSGGDVGGSSGGGGTGRIMVSGAWSSVPPGFTGVKGRGPLMACSRPFWAPECFFLKRFW